MLRPQHSGSDSAPADPKAIFVVTTTNVDQVRRLVVELGNARLTVTMCNCPPLTTAIEMAGLVGWVFDLACDDVFPTLFAAIQ